jgi:hypothetical protein
MKKIVSFLVLISLSSLSLVQSLYGAGGGEEGGDGYQRLPHSVLLDEARRLDDAANKRRDLYRDLSLTEEETRRRERLAESSWLGMRPVYHVSDGWRNTRRRFSAFRSDLAGFNISQPNTFLQPKALIPTAAYLGVNLGAAAYKRLGDQFSDEELLFDQRTKKVASFVGSGTRMLTIFTQCLGRGGFSKLNSAFIASVNCLAHRDLPLEASIKEFFVHGDEGLGFKTAWIFLVRSTFCDKKVLKFLTNFGPKHIPFLIDLIYPLFQVWSLSGHMMPETKDYLKYNFTRYLIKNSSKNYIKEHSATGKVEVSAIVKIVDVLTQGAGLQTRDDKLAEAHINKATLLLAIGNIDAAVDLIFDALAGRQAKSSYIIMRFAKDHLRKLNLELDDNKYVVKVGSRFERIEDVVAYMNKVKKELLQYTDDLDDKKTLFELEKELSKVTSTAV